MDAYSPNTEGLERVTKAEFFAMLRACDVDIMPRTMIASFKSRFHASNWEVVASRQRIGLSTSDSWGSGAGEYFLAPDYAAKGRAAITKAGGR